MENLDETPYTICNSSSSFTHHSIIFAEEKTPDNREKYSRTRWNITFKMDIYTVLGARRANSPVVVAVPSRNA